MGAGGARAPPIFRRWGLSPLDYDIMFLTSVTEIVCFFLLLMFFCFCFCFLFFVCIFRQLKSS